MSEDSHMEEPEKMTSVTTDNKGYGLVISREVQMKKVWINEGYGLLVGRWVPAETDQ